MLHPDQFDVDEAWIAFKLNDTPIATQADGHFDVFALMDASSCFVLASMLAPVGAAGLAQLDVERLLEEAQSHNHRLPSTLLVSGDQAAERLILEAEHSGITVARVPLDQLMAFIGEARQGFRERFGAGKFQ